MAVDAAMVEMMTSSFRDLLDGVRAKGATGPDVDEMTVALEDMRGLAAQCDDVGAYSTQLANGGYYMRFTDAYTRVMLAAAGGGGGTAGPDDATLLANTLAGYDDALQQLRNVPGQAVAIAAVERVLAIGRSGLTYPAFLARLEDERLGEALAGSVSPTRAHLDADLEHIRGTVDPAREAEAVALIEARNHLAAASPVGAVDPFAWVLASFRVRWQHAPEIARRDALVQRLPRLIDLVLEWLDAHTSWAAADSRFRAESPAATRHRIEMARECNPGFYAVRAAQFAALFGPMPWWMRPELREERAGRRILWTDARLDLAVDAVAACTPLAVPPAAMVVRAEAFGADSF